MHIEQLKLTEIAAKYNIMPDDLRRYLFEELSPMEISLRLKGKENQIIGDLLADNMGVFCFLLDKTTKPRVHPIAVTDYVGQMQQGINELAAQRGYYVIPKFNHRELTSHEYFRAILTKYPNAGLLVLIPQVPDIIEEVCTELRRPCLIIDHRASTSAIHTLNVNNQQAIQTIMSRLFELGHRRIAFITGNINFASAQERLEGYQTALINAGLPVDPALIAYGDWSKERAEQLTPDLLAYHPTAIVCSNDLSALGCYLAVQAADLAIPRDISVTGFDDIDMVANVNPPLTTIKQSMIQLGQHAAELLIDVMEQHISSTYDHVFPLEIIIRGSTARAKHQSW